MKITVRESAGLVLNELGRADTDINWQPWEGLPGLVTSAGAIFAVGNGRSGLALRMSAMRLMHLGMTVYVVGETTTPAIKPGDVLLAVSGSGQTETVVRAARVARESGAVVAGITASAGSSLAEAADHVQMYKRHANLG